MPRSIRLLFLSMLAIVAGCATGEARQSQAEGHQLSDGHRKTRLLSVAKRFESHFLAGRCHYEIADGSNAGAFAWPDGRICVTRGLIDLLSDEELAAAVAHEMGHLLADGYLAGRFSLHGAAGPQEVENQADVIGCQLLDEAGISRVAMTKMLVKLAEARGLTHHQRAAVRERIRQLRLASSPTPASKK